MPSLWAISAALVLFSEQILASMLMADAFGPAASQGAAFGDLICNLS
jgi:hypothetical protein